MPPVNLVQLLRLVPSLFRPRHFVCPSQWAFPRSMATGTATVRDEGAAGRPPRLFQGKRPAAAGNRQVPKRFRNKKSKSVQEGSAEEVLAADIQALLASRSTPEDDDSTPAEQSDSRPLPEPGSEIDVEVVELSSTGDGLARQPGSGRVYVVPFTAPGDIVKVKVYRHLQDEPYSIGDFISVTKPSPLRDDSRIQCQYFGKCGGCQFQMLDYADQLKLKKAIVEKAYRNFSQLPLELVPEVQDTIGSPLQYGYRTKLTPHFDGPRTRRHEKPRPLEKVPDFGFMEKSTRKTIDIEDCPIGTEVVRKGLRRERARIASDFGSYTRGATVLLRESTQRIPKSETGGTTEADNGEGSAVDGLPDTTIRIETDSFTDIKTCVTDNNGTSTEYIDDFIFTNPAGSFFQNNNSILPAFTAYIREHILPKSSDQPPIRYLIDAYSGSGLFTITLASLFTTGGSTGIDIADRSIAFARENARLNGLPEEQCRFIAADATQLFKSVAGYDRNETAVVLDPPRKGCDAGFLAQLLRFAPRRICYVSCNVHTQARDIGVLVRGEVEVEGKKTEAGGARYRIESLRGFDFFPQTGHVEGVAFLDRVDEADGSNLTTDLAAEEKAG